MSATGTANIRWPRARELNMLKLCIQVTMMLGLCSLCARLPAGLWCSWHQKGQQKSKQIRAAPQYTEGKQQLSSIRTHHRFTEGFTNLSVLRTRWMASMWCFLLAHLQPEIRWNQWLGLDEPSVGLVTTAFLILDQISNPAVSWLWPQAIADATEDRKETFTEQLQDQLQVVVQTS